ncbi:MAG: carboxypeptidase-like regulatory domain-containing protein, partial [Candidatus Acidiferrales bacterium]
MISPFSSRIKFIYIFLFLMASPAGARAQQAFAPPQLVSVSGMVRTDGGVAIPGATVRAENSATHQRWVTWTDEAGKFAFPGLAPGFYQLSSDALGFRTATLDATFQTAAPPPPPPLVLTLHVLSLAEMSSSRSGAEVSRKTPAPEKETTPAGNPQGGTQHRQGRQTGQRQPGNVRGRRGSSAVPAGVTNAIRQGMGGFQQVNVNVQGGGADAGADQSSATANSPLGAASSSDSLLLNGSVGIGANTFGPAFGFGGGGLPGSNLGVDLGPAPGQKRIIYARRGGPMGGGGPGRFRGGPGVQIFMIQRLKQQVNRVHYGFVETYQNSAF